jgi:Holliday junction resolvasome RuvABC endonuclease subunit
MILAIDPGTARTGWAILNGFGVDRYGILGSGISKPAGVRNIVLEVMADVGLDVILIEKPV